MEECLDAALAVVGNEELGALGECKTIEANSPEEVSRQHPVGGAKEERAGTRTFGRPGGAIESRLACPDDDHASVRHQVRINELARVEHIPGKLFSPFGLWNIGLGEYAIADRHRAEVERFFR